MNADSNDLVSLVSDYADYMMQHAETMEAMSETDEGELSIADAFIMQKLMHELLRKSLK